jgi:LuxR family transcriptional regulator, maltose regulon positive regulatory protein
VKRGNALKLAPGCFWVDAWVLDRQARSIEPGEPTRSTRVTEGAQALADTLRLHQGAFLDTDAGEAWALPMRERIRATFIRTIESCARGSELRGAPEEAIALYLRGVECDGLVESFYQGLMRCYGADGRPSEAASVFRRLQRILASALGTQPSVESHRLFTAVCGAESAHGRLFSSETEGNAD